VGSGNPQSAKFNNVGSNTTVSNSGIRFGGTKDLQGGNIAELDGYYSNKSVFSYNPYYDSSTAIAVGNYGAGNGNLNGWTMNLSPRVKSNFNGLGSGILGYEFNQSTQGGYSAYSPNTYSAMNAANKISNPNTYHQSTQSASLLNQSIYGIAKLALIDSIDFIGGFRHQTQKATAYDNSLTTNTQATNGAQNYSANAGDLALNYSYLKNQKLYVKWNQSYRFPNIDEFWGFDADYNRVFSGILKPQTTQSYEIGGNWISSIVNLNGAMFSSVTQNEIRYDMDSGLNVNSEYNINRKGISLDGSSPLTNKITLSTGGKFQKSVYANGPYSGNSVALSPDLLLNARLNYLLDKSWSLGGVVNYVGSQHYDAGLSDYSSLNLIPAYTVADTYINYTFDKFEAKFTIKNIGNSLYGTTGGYAWITKSSGGLAPSYFYYPSDRRSYFISAKYNF
jgi:iron complex outermembrane receptor protein